MLIYCICTQYLVGAPFASAWHGGDQFVALLRWYGSLGFFDRGLQRICTFWSHTNVHNSFFYVLLTLLNKYQIFLIYKTFISMVDCYGEKTT